MGNISKIDRLSETDRLWLVDELRRCGYGAYEAISERLAARGSVISKTTLHRFGKTLKLCDRAQPDRKFSPEAQTAIFRLGLAVIDAMTILKRECAPGAEHDQP
jgi:hypothetical protein